MSYFWEKVWDGLKFFGGIIMFPIAIVLLYWVWIGFIMLVTSFITWDWTYVTNNIFPWERAENTNFIVRGIALVFAVCNTIQFYLEYV